jgi:hypothetical protein
VICKGKRKIDVVALAQIHHFRIASLISGTASRCFSWEIRGQALQLPKNPTVCYCTKIKATPTHAMWCPPHQLLFDEPLTDHRLGGGLNEPGCDRLTVPVTISVVRDRRHIDCYVVGSISGGFLRSGSFSGDIVKK